MEHVQGESLQQRLNRDGPLPVEETIRIAEQVAEGLEAARPGIDSQGHQTCQHPRRSPHGQRQDHRFWFGSPGRRRGHHAQRRGRGHAAVHVPEQVRDADERSDLFSLGCLYTLCAGRSPFRADSTSASLERVRDVAVPPVTRVNPAVPEWLGQIIDRLRKGPRARTSSARAVIEALRAARRAAGIGTRGAQGKLMLGRDAAPSLPWRR